MKKLDGLAPENKADDLEFPDWNGMDESPSRVSKETAYMLSAELLRLFPQQIRKWRETHRERCEIEFVL